jgi:signal transduction histidine kinase
MRAEPMAANATHAGARFLQSLPREITSSLDAKTVLSALAAGTSRILGATRCSVVQVDPERHPGRGFVFSAVDDPSIEGYSLDLRQYPEIEAALRGNAPVRVRDTPDDELAAQIRRLHRRLPFPCSLVVPISYQHRCFGVLFLRFADANVELGDEAIGLCQMIAFGAAIALNSAREYEALVAEVKRREHEVELLREALRLRMEMLSTTSHDLRTPLNSIIGYLELLDGGAYGTLTAEQHETLMRVSRNAATLLEAVNSLIEHARLEQGDASLSVQPGEVSQLLEELRMTLEPLLSDRPVRLEMHGEGALPSLVTDWAKLRRVLLNLMHNAIKFTERGEISLTVSATATGIRFEVTDTGCGIAERELGEIFAPFYRGNSARAEGPGGLGLAIVKRYCELLHATLGVTSRPGEGSRFTVDLPTAWSTAETAAH